ncbi:hypothetical protein HUU59_09630 [bacterium]|nr:hypothetical protein [bacterium]
MNCQLARFSLLLLPALLSLTSVAFAAIESPHGKFNLDCQLCHTTDNWLQLKQDGGFSHETMTSFPLVGKHKGVKCIDCHTSLVFVEAPTQCVDCHTDIHRGQFTSNCGQCHTPGQWVDEVNFRRMHDATRFPLVGVHASLDCQSCHSAGQYVNLVTRCIGCHAEDFASTTTPDHTDAGFSQNCTECHSVSASSWKGPQFVHSETFPLTGGHALNDCQACHSAGYVNTSTACAECHSADYTNAQNPTHEAGAFPQECQTCHTINSWRPAAFDNHNLTAFPLTGAHILTDCAQCHVGGQYTGTATACADCHQADYDGATNPVHDAAAFGSSCEQCHSTESWRPADFDNHHLTAFPLTGRHIEVNCLECHVGGQFSGTPADCWSCHQEDYNATTDPNHVASNFPQNCEVCHSTDNWNDALFDHNLTSFPLTGAHVQTNCLDCHIGGVYDGTPADCWSCHQEEYNATTDPNHVASNFPHDCAVCHNTVDWEQATFDHNNTDFPLTGAHVQTNCLDCHIGGVYDGTPADCWSCHQEEYNAQSDHVQNNFPHDCAVCHNTVDWEQATFNHNNTDFPLTGAHVQTNCLDCHVGGVYDGTPTDCWSCHEQDYNDADDHLENNFPHDCLQCHNTNDWDSGFNHSNTDFPLTGAHVSVNCLSCHTNGQFENTPTDCWFCHQTDFNNANNPDHNEGYPQECLDCHTTSNWNSNFNHDQQHFPIYSGRHSDEWNLCSECHTTQGNFAAFSCIDCHEHSNQGDVDDEHEDVSGYTYTPTSCYSCHPDGNEGPNVRKRNHKEVKPERTGVKN